MQVQAWCQLDLRQHFTHRFHLYLASRLGVVQAANGLRCPSKPIAREASLQEEVISSGEHGIHSRMLEGDSGLPIIEWEETSGIDEPLSAKRLKYHMEQTIRQLQRYHAAVDAGRTLYTSASILPIFLVEPYFETGVTEDESMLSYDPLPTTTSIRLLKLEPARTWLQSADRKGIHDLDLLTDPIRCYLTVQELEDYPVFDALSYTWSDPCTVYPSQDWRPSQGCPASSRQATWAAKTLDIFVDGKPVSVGPNLYLALQAIRAKWSQSPWDEGDDAVCFSGSIWVDALCINQQDLAEKTAQVGLMSRIYQEAENVWCWLGGEDSLCRQALTDLSNMEKAIRESHGEFNDQFGWKWTGYNPLDPKTYHDFGIPVMTEESWIAIYALLNRAWFKRAWIVQEICFAKNPVFLCGQLEFKLRPVLNVLAFFYSSGWATYLDIFADGKVRLPCEAEQSGGEIGRNNSAKSAMLFRSRDSDTVDPNWGYIIMQQRIAVGLMTDVPTVSRTSRRGRKTAPSLIHLLERHRPTEAGDPRDKVYAFLGMAKDNHGPGKLIADYSLPVRTVYILAMKFLFQSTGTLEALSMREHVREPLYEITADGKRQAVPLPTWVPNFNVRHMPISFHYHMASKGLEPRQIDIVDANLIVSGFQVSSITNLIEFNRERLFELAKFLEGVVPETEIKYSERYSAFADAYADGPDESSNYDHPPLHSTIMQSRFEVLWRTLCRDRYKHMCPAPSNCGDTFTEYLQQYVGWIEQYSFDFILGRWQKPDPERPSYGLDFSSFRHPQEAVDFAAKAYTGLHMLTNELEASAGYEITCSPKMLHFLEKLNSGSVDVDSSIAGYHSFKWPSKEVMDLGQELPSAKERVVLITTQTGHLGLAPKMVQEGDEVWILAGSNSPILLRRTEVSREYDLVGEAYIHGLMYGEAVRDRPGVDLQSVTIF